MKENECQTYTSNYPKNEAVTKVIKEMIPLLSSLMSFVPRSIITNDHISSKSSCAIEVIGFGSCTNYIWKINTIKDDDEIKEISNAYQINRETLEFAAQCINDLRADFPSVSFSITGKFFTFKFDN